MRLELYRRISLAPDHVSLGQIRTETVDRFGALPDEVETLFAIASLRVTARALGVEEISTFRDQVRLKPVEIAESAADSTSRSASTGRPTRPSPRPSTSRRNASSAPISWRSSSAGCWRRRPAARRCPKRLLPPASRPPAAVTFVCRPRCADRALRHEPVDWSLVDPRTLRLVALPVIAASLLAACSSGPSAAATVGETDITDEQLAQEAKLFTFLATLNQQQCGGAPTDGETQEAVCNRFTLGNLIQGSLVTDYAADNDVSVGASEVDDIIANLDEQLTPETVDDELGKLELTRADLQGLAEDVLLFQAVQAAVRRGRSRRRAAAHALRRRDPAVHHDRRVPHPRGERGRGAGRVRAGDRARGDAARRSRISRRSARPTPRQVPTAAVSARRRPRPTCPSSPRRRSRSSRARSPSRCRASSAGT